MRALRVFIVLLFIHLRVSGYYRAKAMGLLRKFCVCGQVLHSLLLNGIRVLKGVGTVALSRGNMAVAYLLCLLVKILQGKTVMLTG